MPLASAIDKQRLLEHFKVISADNTQGRKIGTLGSIKAQQYIQLQLNNMEAIPFKGSYQHPFTLNRSFQTKPVIGHNVIAVINGTKYAHRYIVLSAHYDHLGQKAGRIYNGADDNASGTAALLSIAKQLSNLPIEHTVIILFTDGEESNLTGAKAFVEQNPDLLASIKLNINMDMLAGSKSNKYLHYITKGLDKILPEQAMIKYQTNHVYTDFKVVKGFGRDKSSFKRKINWNNASDHGAFHQKRIPFIYYGVGTHKNYHTENDEYENSNHSLLVNSTNAVYQQLLYIDKIIN